jgi:flagellum-specific peptidoglycan hydrolase FlgJ
MSKYKKASAALLFLLIIWVSFFLLLFILKWVHANKLLSYKGEIDIFIERNDQGSEVYTLLSEESNYYKNMVILGSAAAKNMPTELEKQLKNSIDDIASSRKVSDYYLNVWNGSVLLKSFGLKSAVSGTVKSAVTADVIDKFFGSHGSPLEGLGQCIMDEAARTGVPALVIISVAIHESGWGGSGLANDACPTSSPYSNPADKNSNNLFGYKGSGTTGSCAWKTWECLSSEPANNLGECTNPCEAGKKCYYIIDNFRSYNTKCESIADFANLISKGKLYSNAMKYTQDPKMMVQEMEKAGYATGGGWAVSVNSVMDTFLKEYPYVIIPVEGTYAEIPLPNGGKGRIELVI